MNKEDLKRVAERVLEPLRELGYDELRRRAIDRTVDVQEIAEVDAVLSAEIQYFFDSGRRSDQMGPIRVSVGISDGGWRDFAPVVSSFIKAADGTFIDE